MRERRGGILIVGGFDPSGGAGVLADAKTAEALDVHASVVLSSLTVQSAVQADAVQWVDDDWLDAQLDRLLSDPPFSEQGPDVLKLGLIRDASQGHRMLDRVHAQWPECMVVWDPVLSASAGLDFHPQPGPSPEGDSASGEAFPGWSGLAQRCTVWTPNLLEWEQMNPGSEQTYASHGPNAAAAEWTENHPKSALLLKGGHSLRTPGLDRLFVEGTATEMPASPELGPNTAPKHGSGCVLSSATAALLSKGLGLEHACRAAKHYTEGFLSSTPDLLGHHRASSWQWSSPSRQATSD